MAITNLRVGDFATMRRVGLQEEARRKNHQTAGDIHFWTMDRWLFLLIEIKSM